MRYICILLIRFYRKFLSPLKRSPTCRFSPTCSAYAIAAYRDRGVIAGSLLTAARIARCNPLCRGGYDPVPKGYLFRMDVNLREESIDHGALSEYGSKAKTDS